MPHSKALNKLLRLTIKKGENKIDQLVFGQRISLIATLFGCWHRNVSRPFANENIAYRSCLQCGAIKQFNADTMKTVGTFYFPPASKDAQV